MSDTHAASIPEPGAAPPRPRSLKSWLNETYEVGRRHDDRPVAVARDNHASVFLLDTEEGRKLWVWDIIHERHWDEDAPVKPRHVVTLVQEALAGKIEEAKNGGNVITWLLDGWRGVVDLADAHQWSRGETVKEYVRQGIREGVGELRDQERKQILLTEAAEAYRFVDLAEYWDMAPPVPEFLARFDGPCGLYAGYRNLIVGWTESGKSWLVAMCIKQEIEAGRIVVYEDYENGEVLTTARLRALGVTKEQVSQYVRYVHPTAPPPPELATEVAEKLWAEGARVKFTDALTPVARALGLDLNGGDTGAVEEVYRTVLDPWATVGFAAVLLDNTPRANRYASLGSQHKEAGIGGVVLAVVNEKKFSETTAGSSRIYLNKDRGGVMETVLDDDRRWWATLRVTPDPVLGIDGRRHTDVGLYPPPEARDAMEAMYEEVDRKAATLALVWATLDKQGVTFTESMKQLADWAELVQPLDSRFEHAHTDRAYLTDVLFLGTSRADHEEAGLRCRKETFTDKAGRRRNKYRVELIPGFVAPVSEAEPGE